MEEDSGAETILVYNSKDGHARSDASSLASATFNSRHHNKRHTGGTGTSNTSEFSMRMDSIRRAADKHPPDDEKHKMQQNIQDLTTTVERLSNKLEDFIETTSQHLSVMGSRTGSRQGTHDAYGQLPDSTMSTTASRKYLIKRLEGPDTDTIPAVDYSCDENDYRRNWSCRFEFILAALGYMVGFGNIIRFPFKCYKYGGGAFMIPYVIMLFFMGMPLFFLEVSLGQYSSSGVLSCWRFAPMFEGIGWSMVLLSALTSIYYNVVIAYSLYYLGASFSALTGLPWDDCRSPWASKYCYHDVPILNCTLKDYIKSPDGRCLAYNNNNKTYLAGVWDEKRAFEEADVDRTFPSLDYFHNQLLDRSDGIDMLGGLQWRVVLSLLAASILIFLCMVKGIKSYGKVVYVTTLLPYVLLFILLIRAVLLDHHYDGVKEYMSADWDKLTNARAWYEAAWEIMFSFLTSFGGLITIASYNRFHYNIVRDTFIVTLTSCLTSFVAGFVVFAFLGYIAHELHVPFKDIADPDTGFAFIVFPEIVTHLNVSPIWAIFFFIMLLCIGVGTQFTLIETIATALMDRFPKPFARRHKEFAYLMLCGLFFLCGLLLSTGAGIYIVKWMEFYAGNWAAMVIGICECIAIAWVYGWRSISKDIETMIGRTTSMWWWLTWNIATPGILAYMWLYAWVKYDPPKYDDYRYPTYSQVVGFVLTVLIIIPIPLGIFIHFAKSSGSFFKRWHAISTPTADWGPALVRHRQLVTYQKQFIVDLNDTLPKRRTTLSTSPYGIHSAKKSGRFSSIEEDNAGFQDVDSKLTRKA